MSCAILVPSYDAYADIWPIASACFTRFWPDRSLPMYWMTNGKPVPSIATAITVPAKARQQWGEGIAQALDAIPEEFVLFWIEEVLLLSKVPNDRILQAIQLMKDDPSIQVVNVNRYYYATHGEGFIEPPNKTWDVMAMPAIYRKSVLRRLVLENPDPPEFERRSAISFHKLYPEGRALVPGFEMFRFCDNLLIIGRWRKCAVNHFHELEIPVDVDIRGVADDVCGYMNGTGP
jgi:hypothetical protein